MVARRSPDGRMFTTRELVLLALFAGLIALSKVVLRVPIHVPGHSGMTWMAILLVGRILVRKPWAGTLMGLVSGILAVAVVGGREGLLLWMKYLAPGMVMDLGAFLSGERLHSPVVAIITAAIANTAKLVTSLIVSLALGIPMGYLALGLGLAATTHIVFGGLGGWLGAITVKALRRAGLPHLQELVGAREETA
ncbi:MAG: hypothetical protein XD74_1380 [Actinobacteria bacterium 66_15]|nr:MAG: hypothetical protein XD74_1380 [Actinobacteria bacterium 66_15]